MGLIDWFLGRREAEAAPLPPTPPAPTVADINTALDNAMTMATEGKASAPVVARVVRVTNTIRDLLPHIDRMGLQSTDAYSVVATATDYLPESLDGYLSLPRDWADTRPVINGKSSLLLLIDQLDLLAATASKMFDAANRNDATALVAHGRFLDEKFGGHRTEQVVVEPPHPKSTNPLDLE